MNTSIVFSVIVFEDERIFGIDTGRKNKQCCVYKNFVLFFQRSFFPTRKCILLGKFRKYVHCIFFSTDYFNNLINEMCETKKTFDHKFYFNQCYSTKYVDFYQIAHGNIQCVCFIFLYGMHL